MAVITSKKWATASAGFALRCRFLDGTAKMQKKVKTIAKVWEKVANVKIKFVTKDPTEVRISSHPEYGSWSAVGRDALNTAYFPAQQPTMNFGRVLDESDAAEDRAVILHEFGNALACIHSTKHRPSTKSGTRRRY
jgi:hypothetical protein